MFQESSKDNEEIDYENDFKVVIASDKIADSQTAVHQLKSLDSFSRSSESLALTVSSIGTNQKIEKERRKKKTRSASRGKKDEREMACDYGVSRDIGESFMSGILANVRREGWAAMGESEEERLRLLNMRLEGKLSVINKESEDALCEQAKLRCKLEVSRKEVEGFARRLEAAEGEQRKWSQDKELLSDENVQLEKRISALLSEVNTKVIEYEQVKQELELYKDSVTMQERNMVIIKEEVSMKESVIIDLKKKMAALYSQLQLVNLYRENSDYQAEQVRLELEMAKNARQWVDEQLHTVEDVRDQLQTEVQRVRKSLEESKAEQDKLQHKNQSLEIKLAKLQDARLHDTTQLLFELEQLQKDIIISGEEKESLEERYSAMGIVYDHKIQELEEERLKCLAYEKQYEELLHEFNDTKDNLKRSLNDLDSLEVETREFRKKVASLEVMLATKVDEIVVLQKESEILVNSLREWRSKAEEKDGLISSLNEDLTNVRNSLERVSSERDQSSLLISQLHDDCERVAEQFETSRQALFSKESALQLMEEMNEDIRGQLEQAHIEIKSRNDEIAGIRAQKDQMADAFDQLQASHSQVRQELDELRQSLAEAHLTMAGMEEEITRLSTMNEYLNRDHDQNEKEFARLKNDLEEAQQRIEDLSIIQGEYSDLLERHKQTESLLNELANEHQSLKVTFDWTTKDLESRLEERDSELARIVALKDEVEQTCHRERQTFERSHSQLRDNLENAKFAHVVELATREQQYRERLDQSEKEFSQMCQEKIRCESAIESLQSHINNLVDDYNQKLKDCRSKMLSLEEKSTAYADYELKSRQLLEELARKKGEIEGVLEEWKKMKMHAGALETALARRDASVVEIVERHRMVVDEKDTLIGELSYELKKERDYLSMESAGKAALQRQYEAQATKLDSLTRELKNGEHRVMEMERELGRYKYNEEGFVEENRILRENDEKLRLELERKCNENRELMRLNQQAMEQIEKSTLSEGDNRSTLTSLRKDIDERSCMIDAADKKRKKLVQRHVSEKKEMTEAIRDVLQEKESLTRRAELLQQQEVVAAAVLSRMRSEVKRILFDEEMSSKSDINSGRLSGDQFKELNKLLQETEVPISTAKPLTRLSKCIEELRTQIDSMQDEVSKQFCEDHPVVVEMSP